MTWPFYTQGQQLPIQGSPSGNPGFSDYLRKNGFSNEKSIIDILPNLNIIQQIRLDISLHSDAIEGGNFYTYNDMLFNDSKWKEKLIDIVKGKERNPEIINNVISILKRDIQSHQNRTSDKVTGSSMWHQMWTKVYIQWLHKLDQIIKGQNEEKA